MELPPPSHLEKQEILRALRALRNGDLTVNLSRHGLEGADVEIAAVYNDLVHRMNRLASEMTRISRELGTQGRFGGQAEVSGLEGTWKDLLQNFNAMAASLTDQFRDVAAGVTARANGDMVRRVTVPAQGEVAELKTTLNVMGDQFDRFAAELRRIAREAGTEGKFGGQAEVPGLAGVWKEVAEDVNTMSAQLTTQVRDISRTVRGIVEGNPSQRVTVETAGETRELADRVNRLVEQTGPR